MPSIDMSQVARRAGVSPSTVSRALRGLASVSDDTRARVEAAAAELGYTVSASASSLASGKHRMIGAVVPSLTGWYHGVALEGADEVFRAAGYDLMLVNLGHAAESENRLFHSSLLRRRVDAVLVIGIDFTPEEQTQLAALGVPHIGVGSALEPEDRVAIDERAAARLATEHLLSLGHRRIGHVGGRDDPHTVSTMASLREAGWRDALTAAGVDPRDDWIADGGFNAARGRSVALDMLDADERPTAIFAASDEMGLGVLQAAAQLGIAVPDDLSVVGIDDHLYAGMLGLTTVRQDPAAQGREAARLLLADLSDPDTSHRAGSAAPIQLLVRRTTAPPPE